MTKRHQPELTFATFWNAYPRHTARKEAFKAWMALDPDEALIDVIVTALAWQRATWPDLKYCPYPATYLRSERWTDERPSAPTPTPVLTRFASLGVREQKH